MKNTWLVVADTSKARFFTMESGKGPIEEIKTMEHAEARLHERDMTSDLPGKSNSNGGTGGHSYQNKVSAKDQENINFAKKVASELDAARKHNEFKRLILIAAPGFLGDLRNQLNSQTQDLIYKELAKNLTQLNESEIIEHLAVS